MRRINLTITKQLGMYFGESLESKPDKSDSFDFIIITCGKKKLKTEIPVTLDELYISRLGEGKIKIARLLVKMDDYIFVFSGKLGLVNIQTKSAWYDSKNKIPDKTFIEAQVKNLPMKAHHKIGFIGQKPVFNMLKKLFPKLKNLIPDSKGSGDFTRIVYNKINELKWYEEHDCYNCVNKENMEECFKKSDCD